MHMEPRPPPRAIDNSIAYLNHPSAQRSFPYLDISHERALATLTSFKEVITAATAQPNPGQYIDQQIRSRFDVYKSIGAPKPDGPGYTDRVLFTGYCTPIYDASAARHGPYQWPLYKRPKDLAADPITGETIGRKKSRRLRHALFHPRRNRGATASSPAWNSSISKPASKPTSSPSRVPPSSTWTTAAHSKIGYAGHNGHEYTSPASPWSTMASSPKRI